MSVKLPRSLSGIAAAAIAAALGACSGGGGGGDEPVPIGAIDGGGFRAFSTGPINGFGSIIVNGVRYDTSQADIRIDGEPATEADLHVGQIVRITASGDDDGVSAELVEYDDNVEGPIWEIDPGAGTLVVLGQTVLVNDGTSFDGDIQPRSIDGLMVGDVVEISGYPDADRNIVATRIELDDDGGEFEVIGYVSNLDSTLMQFDINELRVAYSGATLEDFGGEAIADGDLVEAEGSTFGDDGELLATSVERKDDDLSDNDLDDAEIEIEGLVTRFVSATDFDVSGFAATTDGGTVYEDGTAADLALNVLVEIDGTIDANGRILADEIDFEQEGRIRIDATVESIDEASRRVTLLGIPVEIRADTRLEDDSDLDVRSFSFDDIRVGNWLEIRGRETETGSGVVAASRAERDEADGEATIRGFATDVAVQSFRILGLDIDTDANTRFEGVDAATFFATAEGRLVEATGNLNGERFLATEVEFED